MRNYREWKEHQRDLKLLEWNIHNLFSRRMGPYEKQEMDRIGTMLGYTTSNWNVFQKDASQRGDAFMTAIQNGDVNTIKQMAKQNSPFQQAYQMIKGIKQLCTGQNITTSDVQILFNVLKNATKGANMDFNALKSLWASVTGLTDMKDPSLKLNQNQKRMAFKQDVHTPLNLLERLVSIGGGIFTMPANKVNIANNSAKILRYAYPNAYNRMYKKTYGEDPNNQTPQNGNQPNNTQPNNTQPNSNVDATQLHGVMSTLQTALQMPPNDPRREQALKDVMQGMADLINASTPPQQTTNP